MAKQSDRQNEEPLNKEQQKSDRPSNERSQGDRSRGDRPRGDRQKPRREESNSDIKEKVLFINRCSKSITGGKKMSFSALILVGNGKGQVGYGFAKANELTDAIRKGGELARKNMKTIVMDGTTIPHDVSVKWDGATVFMRPAPEGTGIIAGSKVRAILEFLGLKDVMAKSYGTNPINLVRATFKALLSLSSREKVLQARRGEG